MFYAIVMITLAVAYRLVAAVSPSLINFSPLMALTVCGPVYLRDKRLWLIPFGALLISDIVINHHYKTEYGMDWQLSGLLLRYACYGAGIGLGWLVSRRKSWSTLVGGAFAASLIFYLVTNTASWAADPEYAQTLAGWWQALTIGHPEYPPTLFFFRNSLVSDLSFTALFAVVLEYAALRSGQPSLLAAPANAAQPAQPLASV